MTVHRTAQPVSSGVWHRQATTTRVERVSDPHRLRLEAWLRLAPVLPRAEELVSPDGAAYCFVGGAALVASRNPGSRIDIVMPDESFTVDAHFTVDGALLPDEHDLPLIEALADWYGVDLFNTEVRPETLPAWLRDELLTHLDAARTGERSRFELYDFSRDGGGWSLWALSDLGVPSSVLTQVARRVLNLEPLEIA